MREILLRAKEFGTGEWVQGTGVVTDGINTWIVSNKENTPVAFGTTHKKVCPETVGQWTGLVDANGVKVFEGDLLKGQQGIMRVFYGKITGHGYGFQWENIGDGFEESMTGFIDEYEVIGNVHSEDDR